MFGKKLTPDNTMLCDTCIKNEQSYQNEEHICHLMKAENVPCGRNLRNKKYHTHPQPLPPPNKKLSCSNILLITHPRKSCIIRLLKRHHWSKLVNFKKFLVLSYSNRNQPRTFMCQIFLYFQHIYFFGAFNLKDVSSPV